MVVYLNGSEVIASSSDNRGYTEAEGLTEEKCFGCISLSYEM